MQLAILGSLGVLTAQIRVALHLDKSRKPLWGFTQLCDENQDCGLADGELSKVSRRSKDLLMRVERAGKDFNVLVDTNQNGRLDDEKKAFLSNSGRVTIRIRKQNAAKRYAYLPFEVQHEPPDQQDARDQFVLRPSYVASGTLTYGKCSSKISLFDFNLDGRFTVSDSDRGTNLQVDKNNDGKFWGKEENLRTAEILVFCNQNFLVAALDNTSLVLRPTKLQLANVGKPVPDFSFTLLDGQVVSRDSLRGKQYVLDFWASWCVPCVNNLPDILTIRNAHGSLSVFSVNVDKALRRRLARKVIAAAGIREFTAIRGLGDNDPVWQTFGGANSNRLIIPLYVLVDDRGLVRYAGNGGEKLVELRREIEKLGSPTN